MGAVELGRRGFLYLRQSPQRAGGGNEGGLLGTGRTG